MPKTDIKEYLNKPNYFKHAKSAAIFLEDWRNRITITPHFVKNSDILISFRLLFLCLIPIGLIRYPLTKSNRASYRVFYKYQYKIPPPNQHHNQPNTTLFGSPNSIRINAAFCISILNILFNGISKAYANMARITPA